MNGKNLVGPKVREWRIKLGLSQEIFAAKCNLQGWDISRGTLSKIEAQIRRVNDAELFILAIVLKCSVSDFYEGISHERAKSFVRGAAE
jgi:transcriptional regulator with XRE-family HTH domain